MQLLELLWELAHLPLLKTSLVELALEEHLAVLSDPFAIKEQVRKQYVIKCVEDIREVLMFLCSFLNFIYIRCVSIKKTTLFSISHRKMIRFTQKVLVFVAE